MLNFVNPTGKRPRGLDFYGSGSFGAKRDSGRRLHRGLDLLCVVGQAIRSPISGVFTRLVHPYGDGSSVDSGLLIDGSGPFSDYSVKLFYVVPSIAVHSSIAYGTVVGSALDLQDKYPGISDHIHVEIWGPEGVEDPTTYLVQPIDNTGSFT